MDNSGDLSTSSGSENSTSASGDVNSTATEYWYSHYEEFDISSSSTNELSTAGQLAYLAYMVNSGNTYSGYVFQLTADLDMSAYYWVPIGGHEYDCSATNTSYYFSGEFDGNSHTISGLDMSYVDTSSSTYNYMALFGYVKSTSSSAYVIIHDVGIVNSTIKGRSFVSAFVGSNYYYTKIYNCYNKCSIEGNYYVAGFVGYAYDYLVIENCFNSGNITGYTDFIGGIGGYTISTSFKNCYNIGTIVGSARVGGIVGLSSADSICNCYNLGSVSGSSYNVGGIAGRADYPSFYNCFNLGSVSGDSYVGGVIGLHGTAGESDASDALSIEDMTIKEEVIAQSITSGVKCCYYGGDCSQIGGTQGGDYSGSSEYLEDISTLAKTEGWYSDSSYWDSTYAWDFDTVWIFDLNYNDGYPILQWQLESPYTYDEDGEFWYFEDGYMPQSVYGTDGQTAPSDVDASAASEAYAIRLSTSSWAQVEIFSGTDDDYAYVTIYSGENVEVVSAWFVVEPIVWIVAYGSETPTSVTCAVTAKIVTAGYVYSNAGTSFSWAMSSVLGMSVETLESYLDLSFASVGDFAYDSFSGTLSQLAVTDDATTLSSKIAVSSVEEIDALGGSYASTCTDFVAFLLSGGEYTSASDYSDNSYWTRDLAASLDSESTYGEYTSVAQLNNGVYVTKDGTLSNAKLSTLMGARLTMSV